MNLTISIRGQVCFLSSHPDKLPKALINGLDKTLQFTVKGAEHIEGDWDGVYHLYQKEFNCFNVGHLDEVRKVIGLYAKATNQKIILKIIDQRTMYGSIIVPPSIKKVLVPFQEEGVRIFLERKMGNIQCPTGGGKTLVGAEIIRRVARRTLFVVNRKVILQQSKDVLREELGMDVGVIGDGEFDTKDITVATIQGLMHAKIRNKIEEFLKHINLLIIDESHFSASDSYQQLGAMCPNAIYRLGLSATVRRDDGKDLLISSVTGPIIYDIPTDTVVDEKIIINPQCYFIKHSEGTGKFGDWQESYDQNIVHNEWRNKTVADIVSIFENKKVLILVNRIAHGELLTKIIPNSMLVNGIIDKKTRTHILDTFAKMDNNVLIGTSSIFSTGYNNPAIDVIINASGNAGFTATIQSIGRVMRVCKKKNKIEAIYVDFIDQIEGHEGQSWARYKAMREKDYKRTILSLDVLFKIYCYKNGEENQWQQEKKNIMVQQ